MEEVKSFRQRALDAHQEQATRESDATARIRAEHEGETRKAFERDFGCWPESVDDKVATIADMKLEQYGYHEWRLLGTCPRCGAETWSESAYDLAHIGHMLVDFQPHYMHECNPSPSTTETSLAEQLASLIRQIAAEGEYSE